MVEKKRAKRSAAKDRAAAKKTATNKSVPKKRAKLSAAKKPAKKKLAAKKPAPKKIVAKKPAPKKIVAKKPAPKKSAANGPASEVSPVFAGHEARFLGLRASDPRANLQARLEVLRGRLQPGRFEQDFGYAQHLLSTGWAVVGIPDDSVVYTIGLHYQFGQPELLLGSQRLREQPELLLALTAQLNDLGRRVAEGLRIRSGDSVEVAGHRLTFRAYEDEHFNRFPCGYLATFEELFEDRFHTRGGTLPILWSTLE